MIMVKKVIKFHSLANLVSELTLLEFINLPEKLSGRQGFYFVRMTIKKHD